MCVCVSFIVVGFVCIKCPLISIHSLSFYVMWYIVVFFSFGFGYMCVCNRCRLLSIHIITGEYNMRLNNFTTLYAIMIQCMWSHHAQNKHAHTHTHNGEPRAVAPTITRNIVMLSFIACVRAGVHSGSKLYTPSACVRAARIIWVGNANVACALPSPSPSRV